MKKITLVILLIVALLINFTCFAKTIDMDVHLSKLFNGKQYEKCYKLSKIVSSNRYSEYILSSYGIKYKESYVYVSDSAKYFEYKSLRAYDLNMFNYFYMIKNEEVLKVFNKSEVYPAFIAWADSLYNSPITDGGDAQLENMITKKYSNISDIPEVKEETFKNSKLLEIYKFLKETDTIALNNIFFVDNKGLVDLVKNRKEKNILSLPSNDFNMNTCHVYYKTYSQIQRDISKYLDSLLKKERFLCKEQISEYLFSNTNFTNEEKMFVTFYFIKSHMGYNRYGRFTDPSNIDKMILYRHTVCNGFALLMNYFLNQNNIQCYKIHINTDSEPHANNIVIINNKVYFTDATWDIYFREINDFPDTVTITEGQLQPVKLNYKKIKDLSYIVEVVGYDSRIIKKFETIQNKKGAL